MAALSRLLLLSLAALLPPAHSLATQDHGPRCRCRPQDPCWPSRREWQAFNSSIDGTLVSVRQVAAVFHDPAFDAAACNASTAKSTDSVWRASQPGAVQWTNWEAWPERNESCFFDSPRSTPCRQGRVSLFSAAVEKAEHIQAAVRFAATHNLRLAIKNSGHCFMGRSTAPDSLQISTNKLKSISFTHRFVPAGAPQGHPDQGSAVTIGAGVDLKELYGAAARRNLTLVAGMAHTVGAAGGYVQGGGHSPLGNWKGMGSDNALEFTVVNAKGDLVIVNDHQNQDLFWALRGGGGGTFGVVVSVSVRTFASVGAVFVEFGFVVHKGSPSTYWELVKKLHTHLPAVSDAGGCDYYFILPKPQVRNGTEGLLLSGGFLFANETRKDKVREVADPLATDLGRIAGARSMFNIRAVPRVSEWINASLRGDGDVTGGIVLLGSRLVSRDLLTRPDGPERVGDALTWINETMGGVGFTGHLVAGGAVARSTVDSALNPAWRRTLTHIAFGVDWNSSTPAAEQSRIRDRTTKMAVAKLKALEPGMGAYVNEANAYEDDFQWSFWGANYGRLYAIKKAQDPMGLFIARKGVGSEDWDDAGLCRAGV